MNRWRGLTFDGTDATTDGTGLVPEKIETFLTGMGNSKPTHVRLVKFYGLDPTLYIPTCQVLRAYGVKVLLLPVDSYECKHYSVREYEKEYHECMRFLRPYVDMVEVNEINGPWCGALAGEKLQQARGVARQNNCPFVVTLYFDNDDPGQVWQWVKTHPFAADAVLMSDYTRTSTNPPLGLNSIIGKLAQTFPMIPVGYGEFGGQNAEGVDDSTPLELEQMITEFETRLCSRPNDIGGGFYWSAYEHMVRTQELVPILRKVWE